MDLMDSILPSIRQLVIFVVCSVVICLADDKYRCPGHLPRTSYLRTYGDFCFEFSTGTMNWVEARDKCISRGGYLAEPRNQGLQSFMESTANVLGYYDVGFWIGLIEINKSFRWNNGNDAPTYTNWGYGEPDGCTFCSRVCTVMKQHHGFKWYDKYCSGFASPDHHYICQYVMGPATTTTKAPSTTTTTPRTTTTTPATTTTTSTPTTTTAYQETTTTTTSESTVSAKTTQKTMTSSQQTPSLPHTSTLPTIQTSTTSLMPAVVGQQVDDEPSGDYVMPVVIALTVVASLVLIVILFLVLSKKYRCVSREKLFRGQLSSFDNVAYGVSSERVRTVNDLQNNLNQMRAQQNVYSTPYLHAISETDAPRPMDTKYDNLQAEKNCSTFSSITTDKLFVNLDQADEDTGGACGGYDTLKSTLNGEVSDIDTLKCNVNNYAEIQDDRVPRSSSLDSRHYDEINVPNEAAYSNVNTFLKDVDEDEISKPSVNLSFDNNLYKKSINSE